MSHDLHLEPWYFIFVDIIYVGAIKNIGRVVSECSSYSFCAYMTAASFLVIMFSTRLGFDVFSHSYETRFAFNLIFIFAYNIGVILMSFFIEMKSSDYLEDSSQCQNDELFYLGGCYQSAANSSGFAAGFLLTRGVLIFGYLYILVFPRTSELPQQSNEADEVLHKSSSEKPNSQLLESFSKSRIISSLQTLSERLIYTRGAAAGYQLGLKHHMTGRKHLKILDQDQFEGIYYIIIYAISSIVVGAGFDFKFPQPYWLITAAVVESLGGLFKDQIRLQWEVWKRQSSTEVPQDQQQLLRALEEVYKRTASFYQARLFSFYIVVLGEAVLGLVIIPVVSSQNGVLRGVLNLVFAYFIIFSIGYRYSIFTTTNTRKHVMASVVGYKVRNWYIWLHVCAAFAILMVSNAIEHVFEDMQLESCHPEDVHHEEEYANTLKLGVGLVTVWLCLVVLRMLHFEVDTDGHAIIFGWHYGHYKLIGSILAMTAHAIGSAPGLIPQGSLLIYHGMLIFLPIFVVLASRRLNFRRWSKGEGEKPAVEMTVAAIFTSPIRSSFTSERFSRTIHKVQLAAESERFHFENVQVSSDELVATMLAIWVQHDPELWSMIFKPPVDNKFPKEALEEPLEGGNNLPKEVIEEPSENEERLEYVNNLPKVEEPLENENNVPEELEKPLESDVNPATEVEEVTL